MRAGPVFLSLLTLTFASPVRAQDPAAKSRALYHQAQQVYDRGEFANALELFVQAYEAKALPGFLFNIAQCHRQLRNYERSGFYFKRYLEVSPHTPNARVVRELILEVAAKQAGVEELKRTEASAAQAQEVELARIAVAHAESEATARRDEETQRVARALREKSVGRESSGSVLTRWWLWAGVGVIVAGAAAGAVYVGTAPSPRPTTLGTESAR